MKQNKRIFTIAFAVLALTALLCVAIPAFGEGGEEKDTDGRITVLCVGFDEAASNTDVLMLLSIDTADKQISVLQIPRDTYCRTSMGEGKINAIYPTLLTSGCKENEALSRLAEEISLLFGIKIDEYAAIDTASLSLLTDKLGGLTLRLNAPTSLGGRTFAAGEHHLDGETVLHLIRYRSNYAEGDLGRLDAQKLILGAAYRKMKDDVSFVTLLGFLPTIQQEVRTSLSPAAQLSLGYAVYRYRDAYRVLAATLPGEAVLTEGDSPISYYAVNRDAALALFERVGVAAKLGSGLTTEEIPAIKSVYERAGLNYTLYTEDTLDTIKIKTKIK